jgi:hypothetical protein
MTLNDTTVYVDDVPYNLNATSLELRQRIEDLTIQNEKYEQLSENLNYTSILLSTEVRVLKQTLSQLMQENDTLSNLTDTFDIMKDKLSNRR